MTRRPEKPRLEWKKVGGVEVPRHRTTWTEGGKRRERNITLDWKGDPQELDRLYWQCERGLHEGQKAKPSEHTWKAVVIAWRKDTRLQSSLAASTKKSYRGTMDALLVKNADRPLSDTNRQDIRAIQELLSDTPRKADHMLQVIKLLWNYAKAELDWPLGDNPAARVRLFGKGHEYEPWPDWMVQALPSAPLHVQIVVELMLGTGQRPNAAIAMRYTDFSGECMWVLDEKNDERREVYCPDRLRNYVASMRKAGAFLLPKNLTQPLGYSSVEKEFRKWRADLGEAAKPFSLHGLRKLAIIQLCEAGCSDAEIQAVTGQSAAMVAYYRAKADKKKMSKAAQIRREQNRT